MASVYDKERTLESEISERVEEALPGVEVLAVELTGPERFTVYVDRAEGVDHALCQQVTRVLSDYLRDYAVDVSSPGLERPLRKPEHFREVVGRTVKLKTAERAKVRGEVTRADEDSVTVATNGHEVDIPYEQIVRGNLIDEGIDMSREIIELVHELERDRGIEGDTLIAALEDALLAAYKKTPGSSRHAVVELDRLEGDFRVFSIELPPDIEERLLEEARERVITELEQAEIENGERSHVLVTDDDLDIDWSDVPENQIKRADVTPDDFGRIAAQTAKQVITQRIREAERQIMYDEYVDRVTEVVTGIVQQAGDRNNVLVDLGKVEALLPRSEQVDGERYEQGSRIKAVITEVRSGTKGPQVILSRRDPELIQTLFELEVPEIADGLVEIRAVAREPGYRSKIAVESHAQGVDPVGACVGPRGSRVRMVVSELRGEKIDIIPWNPEPARFVAKALSPARVREVYLDDEAKEATVVTPDDQLALAIGKEGMNARLAARLTGWKVDIKSDTEFATEEAEAAFAGDGDQEEFTGRCSAILSTGKRCPNTALPGSRYCGVPRTRSWRARRPQASFRSSRSRRPRSPRRGAGRRGAPEAEPVSPSPSDPEPVAELEPVEEPAPEYEPAEPAKELDNEEGPAAA